jgi:hypothetical protein
MRFWKVLQWTLGIVATIVIIFLALLVDTSVTTTPASKPDEAFRNLK